MLAELKLHVYGFERLSDPLRRPLLMNEYVGFGFLPSLLPCGNDRNGLTLAWCDRLADQVVRGAAQVQGGPEAVRRQGRPRAVQLRPRRPHRQGQVAAVQVRPDA